MCWRPDGQHNTTPLVLCAFGRVLCLCFILLRLAIISGYDADFIIPKDRNLVGCLCQKLIEHLTKQLVLVQLQERTGVRWQSLIAAALPFYGLMSHLSVSGGSVSHAVLS